MKTQRFLCVAAFLITAAAVLACGSADAARTVSPASAEAARTASPASADAVKTASPAPGPVSEYWTGDGAAALSVAVLVPEGRGLASGEEHLPAMVQGVLVGDFKKFSAITVLDRQNLEKVIAEGESGIYENESGFVRLGAVANVQYILNGAVQKTGRGFSLQLRITEAASGESRAAYTGSCSAEELDNLTGVKKASADLLAQLGVKLTDAGKAGLAGVDTANVRAETALAKGIDALKNRTVVEAMSYFYQAASYDASLSEAASRVNILAANITSGNMGSDIRNDIQWRDQWRARLAEAERVYADFMKQQPVYFLVYDANLTHGETNYANNTVPISGVTIDLLPDAAWFNTTGGVVKMVNVVREGLLATNQAEKWGLGRWPSSTVGDSPFGGRDQRFEVAVELVNADGKTIGSERVTMRSGYNVEWTGDYNNRSIRLLYPRLEGVRNLGFSRVNAYDITDRLTVRIAGIDGVAAETAAKAKGVNILTEAEYARLPDVAAGVESRNIARLGPDFEIDASGTITGYKGKGGWLVIPANFFGLPVTAIGEEAFVKRDGVDKYGINIYKGTGLTGVVIPNSVTIIGDRAFANNQLTSVVIPNSVTSIGREAFEGNQLTSVVIPDSVRNIGYRTFVGNRLTSVVIPNSVTSIGMYAFASNRLTSVVIPDSVTSIGDFAFRSNQLTSVVIPDSVTSIGEAAFAYNQLTSVVIPDSVTSIDSKAFYYNPLTSVVIGKNVDIEKGAFSTLEKEVRSGRENISYFEDAYNKNGKKAGTYTRPDAKSKKWTWEPQGGR